MQLVELVVQGVRRFANSQKISFHPGLNVVYGPNECGKSTLAECVHSLLYPQSSPSSASLIGWENPQVSRAALTVKTADGQTLRIVRDYVTGACTLSTLNAASGKFEGAGSGAESVEARLREITTPSRDLFDALFFLKGDSLPTGTGGGGAAGGAALGGGGIIQSALFEGNDLDAPEMTPEEKKAKIEELRGALTGAKELEKVQFELDGLEAKKFDLQNKLKSIRELENNISQAKGQLSQFGDVTSIDDDMMNRLTRFHQADTNHAAEMRKMEGQRESLQGESEIAASSLEPFFKNPMVIGGAAGSLVSIVLGIAVMSKLVFLLLPSLGVAGVGFYLWNEKSSKVKKLKEDFEALSKKITETQRKFEVETAVVQNLMQKLEMNNIEEIIKRKKAAKKSEDKVKELETELKTKKQSPEIKQASDAISEIEGKISDLQDKLSQFNSSMDAAQIEREIKQLESELSGKKRPGAAMPGFAAAPSGGGGGGAAGVETLLKTVAIAAGQDIDSLAQQQGLYAQISPFTGGRHPAAIFQDGQLKVAGPGGVQLLEWGNLSASTRDAAFLALVLGSAQLLTADAPFVWDDVGARFDDERIGAIAGALKGLLRDRGAQGIWLTSRKDLAAQADHLIKLAK